MHVGKIYELVLEHCGLWVFVNTLGIHVFAHNLAIDDQETKVLLNMYMCGSFMIKNSI